MQAKAIILAVSAVALGACGLQVGGSGAHGSSTPSTSSSSSATSGGTGSLMPVTTTPWLMTSGNQILTEDGNVWTGRGVTVHDTRNCAACTFNPPDVAESERRIDTAIDTWHATFVRLLLESYAAPLAGQVQWQNVTQDANYFADVVSLVHHIGSKPNVYVLLSLWVDPAFTPQGWPTDATAAEWTKLATAFKDDSYVMFAVANEPQSNDDGSSDAQVWAAMNSSVQAIRDAEAKAGGKQHIVSVQATRDWARYLDYYETHPITAGNGKNVVYETHIYNPQSEFQRMLVTPAQTLPVIVAEFGPVQETGVANMSTADVDAMMTLCEQLKIPYTAWTFHQKCGKASLLVDSGQGCGVGMTFTPSPWGQQMQTRLAQPPTSSASK